MDQNAKYFMGCWIDAAWRARIMQQALPLLNAQCPYPPGLCYELPLRWHLTLAYLGQSDRAVFNSAALSLSALAEEEVPVAMCLDRLSAFQAGTVLWIGPKQLSEPLRRLYEAVHNIYINSGLSLEKRSFQPHITLARAPKPWSFTHRALNAVNGSLDHFSLIQSSNGHYRSVETWFFQGRPKQES